MNTTGQTVGGIEFFRIDNDFCGNPRYVVHFLQINYDYERAHKIALKCGGAKYRGKWFGGGFVFQSYSLDKLSEKLNSYK